ncbi:MAG: DegV family protein [Anaerolineae bacterium]|nr:DegV family protein [Thermoflexales bacterium]MDW8395494.1 DegV family protein [Anaerolineae bacterium]
MACAIVSDSTCDLPAALAQRYRVGIAPTVLQIDGQTYYDNITLTREAFYAGLPTFRNFPKTAAASPEVFVELYRNAGAEEIVSIHLSRKLSAMWTSAQLAAQDVAPHVRVHVFDSETISMGTGWMVLVAAEMAAQGASAEDILAVLEDMRPRTRVYALLSTLKYLHKGGRVNRVVAGVGELLQIKPLLEVYGGEVHLVERVRLKQRGVARLLELALRAPRIERLCVLYTGQGMEADIAHLQARAAAHVPIEQQLVQQVTPGIGAHLGPGGLGFAIVEAQSG